MNHKVNAWLHKLPPCPECNAFAHCPCTNASGYAREPHAIRMKVKEGVAFVVLAEDARAVRKLRAIREIVETIEERRAAADAGG